MNTRQPGIYAIKNTINNRCYIGSAISITARWTAHKAELRSGRHQNARLLNAWRKYGENAFLFSVLELVSNPAELIQREQYWIDQLHSADRQHGYNICPVAGSMLGVIPGDETRAKMSAAHTGRKQTPEAIAKTRAAHIGAKRSEETKRRIAAARLGKPQSPEQIAARVAKNTGQKRTDETRAKMSAAAKGKPKSAEHREKLAEAARRRHAKSVVGFAGG